MAQDIVNESGMTWEEREKMQALVDKGISPHLAAIKAIEGVL